MTSIGALLCACLASLRGDKCYLITMLPIPCPARRDKCFIDSHFHQLCDLITCRTERHEHESEKRTRGESFLPSLSPLSANYSTFFEFNSITVKLEELMLNKNAPRVWWIHAEQDVALKFHSKSTADVGWGLICRNYSGPRWEKLSFARWRDNLGQSSDSLRFPPHWVHRAEGGKVFPLTLSTFISLDKFDRKSGGD